MVSAVASLAMQVEGTGDVYVGREHPYGWHQLLWESQEDRSGELRYPELAGMAYRND